jgi:outer membrane receptor protein involved in Fe transport
VPFARSGISWQRTGLAALTAILLQQSAVGAQEPGDTSGVVTGRVTDAVTGEPVAAVLLRIEGIELSTLSDTAGVYRLSGIPPGPQILRAQRIGYAFSRVPITVPARGALVRDVSLAQSALQLEGVVVTADPSGRAEGELGTASVVGREAIAQQPTTSLSGVLSLIPGMPLQPPGLEEPQQVGLRAAPTTVTASAALAAFGTTIVLDGVPLSNNTNLQIPPSGVYGLSGAAGGGIDLRRLPASTIERVEVIRGVPSARYGDLTQGAVVVETRAGVIDPDVAVQFDSRTLNASLVAGRDFLSTQTLTGSADVTRYLVSPGLTDDRAHRFTFGLAHRVGFGAERRGGPALLVDTRFDLSHLREDRALRPEDFTQFTTWNREWMFRFANRSRLRLGDRARLNLTLSLTREHQKSYWQTSQTSGAMPFTDRLTEGRSVGYFIAGQYLAWLTLDGDPWQMYGRLETELGGSWFGPEHRLVTGVELKREWNAGPGYRFDIAQPPQISFDGVRGFDRPRPFSEIPALATTALYADDRITHALAGDMFVALQAGVRLDLLHRGTTWVTAARDAVVEPRLNAELSLLSWLRLRGGWGRTAKLPRLDHLYPAPVYYDLVNVNWYPSDPAERLAVLTTFIEDRTNPDLGFSVATKAEAGFEMEIGDAVISAVAYRQRVTGGVGQQPEPGLLLRDHYVLQPTNPGMPPNIIEPPDYADTIPIVTERPANNTVLSTRGVELTAFLPEIALLRTRFELQGAWIETETEEGGLDVGGATRFRDFQLTPSQQRIPYWKPPVRGGRSVLATYRIIHQQPELGLVITAAIQHNVSDRVWDEAATDTLAFAGYMTRAGQLVPVPPEQRADPQYADLRRSRTGLLVDLRTTPADWMMSLQVAKTMPFDGRLSFWAFNAFDRRGFYVEGTVQARLYTSTRFGLELTLPLGSVLGGEQ